MQAFQGVWALIDVMQMPKNKTRIWMITLFFIFCCWMYNVCCVCCCDYKIKEKYSPFIGEEMCAKLKGQKRFFGFHTWNNFSSCFLKNKRKEFTLLVGMIESF